MPARTFLIMLLAVAALAACGRRGELEPPRAMASPAPAAAVPANAISPLDPGSAAGTETPSPPEEAPKKRFFLDFLL
jgi:predicted small lipoprotein YifL